MIPLLRRTSLTLLLRYRLCCCTSSQTACAQLIPRQGANLVTRMTTLDVDSCIASCDQSNSCVAVAYDLTLPNGTPCSSYWTAGDLTSPARVVISPASTYGGSVYFKKYVYPPR